MSGTWTVPPASWDRTAPNYLTHGDLETYLSANLNYLKTHIALEAASALTVASGVITITQGHHKVAGESAADDEVDTISGGAEGLVILLRSDGNAITYKNGTGNLATEADVIVDDGEYILLVYDGSNWKQLDTHLQVRTVKWSHFEYPNAATDWTPDLTGAVLPAAKTSKKCWLSGPLEVGQQIISYKLIGDGVESAAITLDCKLVRVDKTDPITTEDVAGGAITQITADGNFSAEAVLTDPEVAVVESGYKLEILGTTGAGDEITVMGADVVIATME